MTMQLQSSPPSLTRSLTLSAIATLVSFIITRTYLHFDWSTCIALMVLCAYVPFYVDGAEYYPQSYRVSRRFMYRPVWKIIAAYFPSAMTVDFDTTRLSADAQCIFACHPHGVTAISHILTMTDAVGFLSRVTRRSRGDICASILFAVPLIREIILLLGCVDASLPTCHRVLSSGYSLQLFVGGEREQLLTDDTQPIAYVTKRRGFIRLALQYQIPIVPIYTFGEDRLYSVWHPFFKAREWITKRFRIAIPVFWGYGIWPYNHPIHAVIGAPIEPIKGASDNDVIGASRVVNEDDVTTMLETYKTQLVDLFDRHKGKMPGYEQTQLKIV